MTDAARENLVLLIALLSVLVFAGGAALFAVGLMLLHREEPAPKPQRAKPHVAHVVPRPPEPATNLPALAVEYRPATVMIPPGGLGGDETEQLDQTRFDPYKPQAEFGPVDKLRDHTGRASRVRWQQP